MTSVHLRVKGWPSNGTITVPGDGVQTIADLAGRVRDQGTVIERLTAVLDAAESWLKAYDNHPEDSDECRDAHRALVAAVKAAK